MRRGEIGAGALLGVALLTLVTASPASAAVDPAPVLYRASAPAAETTFFDHRGVQLTGSCSAGGESTIRIRTTRDDGMLFLNGQGAGVGEEPGAVGVPDFDPGDQIHLLAVLGLDGIFDVGQVVFSRPDGRHVTIDWAVHEPFGFPPAGQCAFWGSAVLAGPGRAPRKRRRVDYRADAGKQARTILDARGLRLRASCRRGRLAVVARTRQAHAVLHANSQRSLAPTLQHAADPNLRTGERFNLFARLRAVPELASGQLVYTTPGGAVVSVDWLAHQGDAYDGRRDCAFAGAARTLGARARERARFARKRAAPPIARRRGGGGPAFQPFFTRGPVRLHGACGGGAAGGRLAFVDAEVGAAGAFLNAEQFPAGAEVSGASFSVPNRSALLRNSEHASGHAAFLTIDGEIVTLDWLAEEGDAFGKGRQRRRCLVSGTTEYFPAAGGG